MFDQICAVALFQRIVRFLFGSQKWLRLAEQISPIYKWTPGWLSEVQSCWKQGSETANEKRCEKKQRPRQGRNEYAMANGRPSLKVEIRVLLIFGLNFQDPLAAAQRQALSFFICISLWKSGSP